MKEQLQLVIDLATNDAVKNVQALKRAGGQLEDGLEDTRTAAQRMADEIDAATSQLISDMEASKRATDALGQALGSELAAKIGQGGIDEFIADLRRAGLTFQEIEGDADRFAQSLKRIDDVTPQVQALDSELGKVRATTDQSRSVMANFTGNALAELPGVSGALGPLNTAIGQFGEYAADGNIKLSSFLKTAGGIGAAALAFQLLTEWAGAAAERQAVVDEQTGAVADSLGQVVDQAAQWETTVVSLADSQAVLSQALVTGSDDAARLANALGAMGLQGRDAYSALSAIKNDPRAALKSFGEQMGLTSDLADKLANAVANSEQQLQEIATYEGTPATVADTFRAAAQAAGLSEQAYTQLYNAAEQLQDSAENTDFSAITTEFLNSQVAAGGAQAAMVDAAEAAAGVSLLEGPVQVYEAFLELAAAADESTTAQDLWQQSVKDAAGEVRTLNEYLSDAINKHRQLAQQQWGVERSTLATEDAYADLVTTQSEWNDGVGDDAAELRGLRDATLDVAEQVVDLSLKQLEAQGINADSVEGAQAQVDELKRLQEQYPLVKDEVQKYIDELLKIPGVVNTELTINGRNPGASEVTGPGGTSMTPTNPDTPRPTEGRAGGTTIIIQGALDPVSVARQVRDLLNDDAIMRGAGVPL